MLGTDAKRAAFAASPLANVAKLLYDRKEPYRLKQSALWDSENQGVRLFTDCVRLGRTG